MSREAAWGNCPSPQSMMVMYKQNCVSNPVHLSCQILPYAAGCHLTPPAYKDNSLTSCSFSQDAQATGGCSVWEHWGTYKAPQEPRAQKQTKKCPGTSARCCTQHLGINFSCLQRCSQRKRTWLQGGQGWVSASYLQRELPPAASMSQACPMESQSDRTHHGPKGNPQTSHLLICQQLASLQRWELSRDLFIMVLTLHHTWTLTASKQNHSVYLLHCLAPKAKSEMDTNPVGSQRAGKVQHCCGSGLQDVHVTITHTAGMYQQYQLKSYSRAKWLFKRLIRKKDLSLWETSSHNQQILLCHRIAKQGMLCTRSRVMNFPSKGGDRAEKLHRKQQDGDFSYFYPEESKFKVSALTIKLLVSGTKHVL